MSRELIPLPPLTGRETEARGEMPRSRVIQMPDAARVPGRRN